jgi:hypothetical protein
MKKTLAPRKLKKLQLNRETLRDLTSKDLKNALGGATLRTCSDLCPSSTC